MTADQLVREANNKTGEDLGRTVFRQVREALRAGEDREALIRAITGLYDHLGETGREEDQDAIADVLDSLTRFCSPTAIL